LMLMLLFLFRSLDGKIQSDSSNKNMLETNSKAEPESALSTQLNRQYISGRHARLTKEQRWGSALLSRHQSLEEEFERAKAAVEVSRVQLSTTLHICHLSKARHLPRQLLMRFNMNRQDGFSISSC
ncbi:hypothetical protein XENOCAPTIV_023264, partial [Xenoophorus captivus]